MRYLIIVVLTLCVSALAEEPKKKLDPVNVGGIASKEGATIHGVIRFKGTKPQIKPIEEIAGNAFCRQCYEGDDLPMHDDLVFGKNGNDDTVQNVLVYVSKGLEGKTFEPPKDPAVIDQVGCMYTPHVVGVMVGQTLEIRNSDATLHNVMAMPRNNTPFNIGMPGKGQVIRKVFSHPEFKMNLRCFMHPWMSGYVHVLPNPFFAVSGADGTFAIKGLPVGEYEISVLQETSRIHPTPATATVKVGAGENKEVDFTYEAK
ncbi:MAG TPA: carboxypeptidase regulatory-like domain-containing protein [Tepidisphaeraceae bacterium]|nr:carboxypeptidase regulatory-like domain-containing protein [Tepidisphaeraceae bacterium]